MSGLACYSLGCKRQPLFSCRCSQNTYICKRHTSDHLILQGEHTITSLVQSVSDTQKQKVFEYLNLLKQAISKNIKKLAYFSDKIIDQIIQETRKANKLLVKERNNIEFMIKSLSKYPFINKELLKEAESSYMNDFDIDFNIEKISKAISSEYLIERKSSKMKDVEYAIIFGTSFSNKIDLVNLDTFKKLPLELPVNDMIHLNGCCKISDNNYFIYGGHSGTFQGAVRIIDIKEKSIVSLTSDVPLAIHTLCLYDKNIYCFGGSTTGNVPQTSSKKFQLENKTWISIQSMPEANYNTTASVINDKIFLAGYQSKNIFVYHPIQNNFITTKYSFNLNSYKFLFQNWVVCFGNSLYEIDDNQNLIARQQFNDSGMNLNSSASFRRGKSIYFIVQGPKLYRINTEKKLIELVNINT